MLSYPRVNAPFPFTKIVDSAGSRGITANRFQLEQSRVTTTIPKKASAFLPATRFNIILYAIDKQLNEDSRYQGTHKSYPQPEHISPRTSKPKYKNAQKTHHGSEKGFQFHSTLSGGGANLGRWSASHGRMLLPPLRKS